MKKYTVAILSVLAAVTLVNNASAAFGVTFRTTTTDSVDSPANRLYNAVGVAPQLTDPFWFAIVGSDPIPLTSGATTFFFNPADGINGILTALFGPNVNNAGAGGAFVAQRTVGNGTVAALPSRNSQNVVSIPTQYQAGGTGANDVGGVVNPAYAILFDDANLLDGATFNFDLAAPGGAIPSIGNVSLRIGQDIVSQGFALVAVPEPAMGAYAALGLSLLAFGRRRFSRA